MNRIHLTAALGALSLGLALPAAAGSTLTPEQLAKLPPAAQKQYVLERVAQQKARAALSGTDVTSPTLTQFDVKSVVAAGTPVTAKVQLSDDLSGVTNFYAYASGPSNAMGVNLYLNYPSTSVKAVASRSTHRYVAPGSYVFDWAYAYDEAGNYSYYDGTMLAALGNTTVTVTNSKAADSIAPSLVGGKLLTTKVSLSATQPGTDHAVYAGLSLNFTDSGQGATAGVAYTSANFCLEDGSSCFWLWASNGVEGQSSAKFTLGGQPSSYGVAPGRYYLYYAYASDHAENYVSYFSTRFGGSTDFANLLVNGDMITVKP